MLTRHVTYETSSRVCLNYLLVNYLNILFKKFKPLKRGALKIKFTSHVQNLLCELIQHFM